MKLLPLVLLLVGASAVRGLAHPRRNAHAVGDTTIEWTSKCKDLAGAPKMPLQCAKFDVPLDYTKPNSTQTLALQLVKVAAVKQPVKGSILFNPGGPGGSGVQFVIGRAQQLMTILGGHFNLIGFDPRGVNKTLPFSCYATDQERQQLEPPTSVYNASDIAVGQNFVSCGVAALQCLNATEDIGGLLGTAFVARDMIQIVNALGEDGMLRYWGFSYGTLLGATVAAMFPDRVDKLVIDGNVNVHQYYSGWETDSLVNLDDVVDGFFAGCAKNPSNCALADKNQTAAQLSATMDDLLQSIRFEPIPVMIGETAVFVSYSMVKQIMFSMLYFPAQWPALAGGLKSLLDGHYEDFLEFFTQNTASSDNLVDPFPGIRCGEQALKTDELPTLMPLLKEQYASSKWGGADIAPINTVRCARWKETANEVYSGNWGVKTKNPILVVGNSYDPVTPLVSARNNSAAFPGSALLHHNGYGHCSLAQPSLCTVKAIQAYFNNGTLPASGAICQPDIPLFSNKTWQQAFVPLDLNDTTAALTRRSELEKDMSLLAAVADIAEGIARYK